MKRALCLLVCLLPLWAAAESRQFQLPGAAEQLRQSGTVYQQDGWTMLTVTAETACLASPGDGKELTRLPEGARAIVCREMLLISGRGSAWYRVFLPGTGYGYVDGGSVRLDEPMQVAYQPGYSVSAALFTVADPSAVRVEILSLDNLEFPVITPGRITAQPQTDGSYRLIAEFATASDICKTRSESLCATLYGADGVPLEVLTLLFDAPNW